MSTSTEQNLMTAPRTVSPFVRMRMLQQMAEALEDEAATLYRRAATFEEEEFLLNREIEGRRTEINRLQLKLESLRAERDGVLEKVETLRAEVVAMREEVSNNEEEAAIATIGGAQLMGVELAGTDEKAPVASVSDEQPRSAVFFQRMTLR
jgi:chromosome segregation ATPase